MELFLAESDRFEIMFITTFFTIGRFYHLRLQHLLPPLFTAFNLCWMLVLPMPVREKGMGTGAGQSTQSLIQMSSKTGSLGV